MRSWLNTRRQTPVTEAATPEDLRAAYERGRRDERARRRKRPVIAMVVAGAALIGGAALTLAALQGSFSEGGAVMDHQIATAADRAEPAIRDLVGG